jgi:hypothetical protein
LCIQDTDFCRDIIPLCPYFQELTDNVLLDRHIKGLNSVQPLQKRGLIAEMRIYNLNNQEQEFFVEFVDHRQKHRLFIFHSLIATSYLLNSWRCLIDRI